MNAQRAEALAALLWLAGCSASDVSPVDAASSVDAALPADAVIAADASAAPDGSTAGADADAEVVVADAAVAVTDAAAPPPDAAPSPDAGVVRDRCAPSAALVERVAPQRLRQDLDELVGLGDRSSPSGQARAAAYVRAELDEAGLDVREQTYLHGASSFVNLEVTIAGSEEREQLVMAGAHVDATTGSPGADDNASGATAVLEAARVLAGCRPRRSIRLVFFSNEEANIAGSTAYVAELATRAAPSQVVGFIAMDMVAFPPANGELALVTKPAYRPLAVAMQAAVDRWTSLPTALSIGEACG